MPLPDPRLLLLCEAGHRVADRCSVSIEEAKAALDRAFREHVLVPFDSRGNAIDEWEYTTIDWEHSSITRRGPSVTYTLDTVQVFRQHVDDWVTPAMPALDQPLPATKLPTPAEAQMATPQPWRFIEPYWVVQDVLGWLIDRDPKRFGRIITRTDLGAAARYKGSTRTDANPARTLLHAFQEGGLLAFRDGQTVPTEFWSTKSTAVIRNDVESRVRRKDVLALWPEAWNWSQAIVWAVWRDEELVALCDLDGRRYAERGAERIRAGLRPAGSEQDLRTLLRAGRIRACGHQDGDDAVGTVPATDWPEWAGMPSGWIEHEITFDAGAMRRELTYIPEAVRPQNLISDPDWVVRKLERRSRRVRQLRRFRDCQGRRRRWLSFEEIADWCAREPGTLRRNETLRAQAYADLRDAMLAGEFGHGVQSRVLYFHPDPGPAEERLRLAPEGLRTWLDFYGADNPVIMTEILSRCWLPQDLCRRWYARQGLVWPGAFDRPGAQRAAPVPGKRLSTRSIVATREKSSTADENEPRSNLDAAIGPQEKTPGVGRKRAAYRGALEAWMAQQELPVLRRMGPASIAGSFRSHCERHLLEIVPLLPKRLRSMESVIERIIQRRVEVLRTQNRSPKSAGNGQ